MKQSTPEGSTGVAVAWPESVPNGAVRASQVRVGATHPAPPLRVPAHPRDAWLYEAVKRALDAVAAACLLVLLAPLMAVIALAVLASGPGSVLFVQERIGRGGKPFRVLKFRTMLADRRRGHGPRPAGLHERRRRHKSAGDPRVTRVGRFLRRTSLDELPQLVNVLRGEMSLVGPRPELPEIVRQYEPWQHQRHAVRPGITGWWQVNRDGTRLMRDDTQMDLYYVRNRSFRLDLEILVRTVRAVVVGRGAY